MDLAPLAPYQPLSLTDLLKRSAMPTIGGGVGDQTIAQLAAAVGGGGVPREIQDGSNRLASPASR